MDDWSFADPPDVATFTVRQIIHGGLPVLLVSHDAEDGSWQFLTGGPLEVSDIMIVGLQEMVEHDSTLAELVDLPLGWSARRDRMGSSWKREPE